MDNLDNDPWGSPAMHKGHTHSVKNAEIPPSNGVTAARPVGNGTEGPSRTTSAFTTHSDDPTPTVSKLAGEERSRRPTEDGAGGWGSYGTSANEFPNAREPELAAEGFGSNGEDHENHAGGSVGRHLGGGRTTSRGVEEIITVTLLPEKEGMFLFQHRNYEVKSARRSSTVVRRYSDFVWLLDCLHKRYPFRQLPLLPPKRVAGETIPAPLNSFTPTNVTNRSQWKAFVCGLDFHRKASARACEIFQCAGETSRSGSRTAGNHVSHRTHSKFSSFHHFEKRL